MQYEDPCDHRWNSGQAIRLCMECGQIRTFPPPGKAPRVIWQGHSDSRKPTDLPQEDKKAIAVIVRSFGPKALLKVANITGLPMTSLRAWVATSVRIEHKRAAPSSPKRASTAVAPPRAKQKPALAIPYEDMNLKQKHLYLEENKAEIIKDLQTKGTMGTREVWGFASSTMSSLIQRWNVHDVIYSRGPAISETLLPPFPAFSADWEAAVQVAWLESYSKISSGQRLIMKKRKKGSPDGR